MKTYFGHRSLKNHFGGGLAKLLVFCLLAYAVSGQATPATASTESVADGSLVIPMDNFHQGNAGGTTFNLRAYGLVNALLQNNIPVKWSIAVGKSKDGVDFGANVTRIAGGAGIASGAASFSGGPFIVQAEFNTPSTIALINSFNGAGTPVTVYEVDGATSAPIRYTLTQKPKIAVGPDSGNFGTFVHQALFDAAGIPDYTIVTGQISDPSACYTLATQAHSTDSSFVNLYKGFVQSGGNLLLQCASVNTYENNANGHFQTTNGYSIFGSNDGNAVDTLLTYPNGEMPFNQFIGTLANQDGAVTEFSFAPGSGPANGHLVAAVNSGADSDKMVAAVSQLSDPGGVVFELGGHDYFRTDTGASEIERLNGQRMILNAVFVPADRPGCGLEQAKVAGYKSVRRIVDLNGGPIGPGDTIRWTIDYVNQSPFDIADFQIRDIVGANMTLVAGSNNVTFVSAGSIAAKNNSYDGVGDDATSDLLAPGALLKVNGRIQVTIDTVINLSTPTGTTLYNQTIASAPTLNPSPSNSSDNIDATNFEIFGPGTTPPSDSVLQTQTVTVDPTTVFLQFAPTSANVSIDGMVRDSEGFGIAKAVISITNADTGTTKTVTTNGFGFYRADNLPSGSIYFVSVSHKRYRFAQPFVVFTLNDSVSGLTFEASPYTIKSNKVGAMK